MSTRNSPNKSHRSSAAVSRGGATEAAIAHLPAPLRWVMILGGHSGLSTKEIASLAGVSLRIVQSMQDRGLALIRKEFLMGCGAAS